MKKTVQYVYLGTNGTKDIYYTLRYYLQADEHKKLTMDGKNFVKSVMISEDDLDKWIEVDD